MSKENNQFHQHFLRVTLPRESIFVCLQLIFFMVGRLNSHFYENTCKTSGPNNRIGDKNCLPIIVSSGCEMTIQCKKPSKCSWFSRHCDIIRIDILFHFLSNIAAAYVFIYCINSVVKSQSSQPKKNCSQRVLSHLK